MRFELITLLKSISYRFFASLLTFSIAFVFTGLLSLSIGISCLEFIGKIFGYYMFEVIWNNILMLLTARKYRETCFKFNKSGKVILLSGLNCAGKTSIAKELATKMKNTILLDGDAMRTSINYDLGFTQHDIRINLHKISNLAKVLSDQGFNVIISCISKSKADRQFIKQNIGQNYFEVYVYCDESVLRQRQMLLHNLTKVILTNYELSEYEVVKVDTSKMSIQKCAKEIMKNL